MIQQTFRVADRSCGMLQCKQKSQILNVVTNKKLNTLSDKGINADKRQNTAADKRLNTTANKTIDADKRRDAAASK